MATYASRYSELFFLPVMRLQQYQHRPFKNTSAEGKKKVALNY